jgi:hypothetical protein
VVAALATVPTVATATDRGIQVIPGVVLGHAIVPHATVNTPDIQPAPDRLTGTAKVAGYGGTVYLHQFGGSATRRPRGGTAAPYTYNGTAIPELLVGTAR